VKSCTWVGITLYKCLEDSFAEKVLGFLVDNKLVCESEEGNCMLGIISKSAVNRVRNYSFHLFSACETPFGVLCPVLGPPILEGY